MRVRLLMIQAAAAGIEAGLLSLGLLLRLNAELELGVAGVARSGLVWAAWGVVVVGSAAFGVLWLVHRREDRSRRRASTLAASGMATMLFLTALLTRVNAGLYEPFLSGTTHRILGQDAVAYLLAALVVAGLARWGRRSKNVVLCWTAVGLAVAAPLARVGLQPTPAAPPVVEAGNVADPPPAALLVIGMEGLDVNFALTHADSSRLQHLERLLVRGAWGRVRAFRPFRKTSLWTSAATGCYPRRHGVKSGTAWSVGVLGPEPVRLLPWTPWGGRWFVPPWADRRRPPPSRVPPLWSRLGGPGRSTLVVGWPREAGGGPGSEAWGSSEGAVPEALLDSLAEALEPFPDSRAGVLEAVGRDAGVVRCVVERLGPDVATVWAELESLARVRREFAAQGDEGRVLELELELLDLLVGDLLTAWGDRGPIAVVSPYGMAEPTSWDRLRRVLGGGDTWRASRRGCPDGMLVLEAGGVVPGRRFDRCSVVDLAPTLSYLLDRPLDPWMEGRVILDAVDPAFLDEHPLRVAE